MKEKLYTIPMNDAMNADDECPFCYIERSIEQDQLDYVLGSCASYMEADNRELTDAEGFCRMHFKKLCDYGNTLGNGWMLKTHYMKMRKELEKLTSNYAPGKKPMFGKKKAVEANNAISAWVEERNNSCFICNRFHEMYDRYMDTFFYLYENDEKFRDKLSHGKGMCLPHFGDVCNAAENTLPDKEKPEFFKTIFKVMNDNMARIQEDVNWLIEKFDYLHKDDPWKNSKDAVPRAMQKLKGGYPSDPVYKPR
ncbi:MAG: hypothetical protein KBS85_06110 [Lachnospiraceae bacterium]|nr:hypothetical protein [Candidatus Merdinaster equi]